jgi:hypothetical protein
MPETIDTEAAYSIPKLLNGFYSSGRMEQRKSPSGKNVNAERPRSSCARAPFQTSPALFFIFAFS